MATAFKNVATIPSGTADTIVYTCPIATTAIVKIINVYNSHSGSVTVLRKITDSSTSTTVILDENILTASSNSSLTGPFVLEESDTLLVNCTTGSVISVSASVLEVS
jgi:hypothetical protein|tara:strand:- start:106 stop:426 length:321 start_codon:yes stop_codon:yes gene_type:complete